MRRYLAYSLVVLLSFAAAWFCKPSPPLEFSSIAKVAHALSGKGIYCKVINADSSPTIVVSDTNISDEEAVLVQIKHASSPRKGTAVIQQSHKEFRPINSEARLWGNVHIVGDQDFIKKLESILN